MVLKLLYFVLFANIYCVICNRNSSLTFVIDDTLSMHDDIDQVRLAAEGIMKVVIEEKASEIADIVLVTFNDPEVLLRNKTSSSVELKRALDDIQIHNNNNKDCAEYALSGIELALKESRPNSYLFVFTDASAKDYYKVNEIKSLCEKKQSQVVFVLTGDCGSVRSTQYRVYSEIARASSGQLFNIGKTDVKDLISTIRETVRGKKSVVTWKILQPSYHLQPVRFTVDDKTDYVIISTSGSNIDLHVTDTLIYGNKIPCIKIFWNRQGKVVKMVAPSTGDYFAWVRGDSEVSIIVYARTDFTFEHGFSEVVPKSLSDTSKQPIAGRKEHLSILVTDPEHAVVIETARIIDISGIVLTYLPLRKTNGDFYITDTFVAPTNMFKIMITGVVNGKSIQRVSRTAIEPQPPPKVYIKHKAPEVNIVEGRKTDVNYGREITLTCKVSAYPAPAIVWASADGTILNSASHEVELPYDYISYLKLSNLKNSGTYHCIANNDMRFTSSIVVNLRPPIRHKTHTGITQISVNYGKGKSIVCDLTASLPIRIKWFYEKDSKLSEIINSEKYEISEHGSTLHINSVEMNQAGKYSCEAVLISDPNFRMTATTDLIIDDLSPPILKDIKIIMLSTNRVKIVCKIAGGLPLPTLSWQVKLNGEKTFKDLLVSGEELIIERPTSSDAGQYRCVAKNPRGDADKIIDLIAPTAVIENHPGKPIPYLSNYEFTCKVIAFPPPNIEWRDGKGNKLYSQSVINNNVIISRLQIKEATVSETYKCFAENTLGRVSDKVHLEVAPAITKINKQIIDIISVQYGTETIIDCDLRSAFPFKIEWYHELSTGKRTIISNSGNYKLLQNGSVLKITPVDLDRIGKYTCEASLINNPSVKKTLTIDVRIKDLDPPVIQNNAPEVQIVRSGDKVKLSCKITGGVPRPTLSWQVKLNGEKIFKDLSVSGEEMIIESATLSDAGQYRCVAKNPKGEAVKITDLIVTQAPIVVIENHPGKPIPYLSNYEFTCKVIASPLPNIEWRDGKGNKLDSQNDINNNVIRSRLQIYEAKISETYECFVENTLGRVSEKVHLEVAPAITKINKQINDIISVQYKGDTTIDCDLSSELPFKIEWYHELSTGKRTIITNSGNYKLLQNGSVLKITSVDLDGVGKYTCEASLMNDPSVKKTITTDVKIKDLSPPVFEKNAPEVITAITGHKVKLSCKISKGVPRPDMRWQIKNKGSNIKTKSNSNKYLQFNGEELTIEKVSLTDAGSYQCSAKNDVGQAVKTIELVVQQPPISLIEGNAEITVPYGSTNTLLCRSTGIPMPKITWRDAKGNTLNNVDISTKDHDVFSRLKIENIKDNNTLSCRAENSLGTTENKVQVMVSSPFVVYEYPEATTSIHHGESKEITCNVSSAFPLKTKWYRLKSSLKTEIQDSDNFKISPDGLSLQIMFMDIDLGGKYTCETVLVSDENQKLELSTVVQIDNLRAPEIYNTEDVYYGVTGDIVLKIPCNATGVPNPTITWKQDGKVVTPDNKVAIRKRAIYIKNPTEADSKKYTCEAENALGTVTRAFEAIVTNYIYYDMDKNKYIYLLPKESKDIQCDIPNIDPKDIRWYLNGDLTSVRGSIYPLKDVGYSNDGNYTCRVSTKEGATLQNYVVDVGYRPTFLIDYASPVVSWSGNKDHMLDCSVNAKPTEMVKWYYNGKPLDTKDNSFNELPVTDWGKYTCQVSNVHGSVQRTFDVTYLGCLINRTVDSIQNTPLLVTNKYEWPRLPSENEFLTMKSGETLTMLCSTDEQPNNTFKNQPSATKIEATCNKEDQFLIDGKTFKFNELICKDNVKASSVDTGESCHNGKKVVIGFKLNSKVVDAYDVCYDEAKQKTLYTKVVMIDSNLGNKIESLTGNRDLSKHGDIVMCQYNQRFFVSPEDVAFGPAQIATFSQQYNAIQVYEPCEGSSMATWDYIENTIRSSVNMFDSITVWTGGSHYASNGVPRYLWKVLQYDLLDIYETIVFVNAPDPKLSDKLCKFVAPSGIDFNVAVNAYTCSFEDFLQAFNLPESIFD